MDHLPIPELRSSWISAIIIAVCSFFVYYLIFYPFLLEKYDSQFYQLTYSDSKLSTHFRVPRNIYSAGPVFVFVSVTNESNEMIKNVGIYLISDNKNSSTGVGDNKYPLVLPFMYDKDKIIPGIVFDEIAPLSTVSGRMSLLALSNTKISEVKAVYNNPETVVSLSREPGSPEIPTLTQWKWRALQHGFIETLLLPPWSNGLIFVLAMFSSYLANRKGKSEKENEIQPECKTEEKEPESFTPEWQKYVWINLVWAAIVMGVIIFLITAFLLDWPFFIAIYGLLIYLLVKVSKSNIHCDLTLIIAGIALLVLSLGMIRDNPSGLWVFTRLVPAGGNQEEIVFDIALIGMAILSSILLVLSLKKCVAKTIEGNKGINNEKDSLKSPIPNSPSKPLSLFNKRNIEMKREKNEKKKVNRFETYDLRVEQRIKKEWAKIKKRKNMGAEELALRVFAIRLETKRYYETDWVWRIINFFRPRSDGLQELLAEIQNRIEELDEAKEKGKGKGKAVGPMNKLSENGDAPASKDTNNSPDARSDGMPHKLDSEEDTDQKKEDNPLNADI